MKTSKLLSHAERLENFDDVLKNRVFARDVFKVSSICLLQGEVLGGRFFLGFVLRVLHRFKEEFLYPGYTKLFRSRCFSLNRKF